MARLSRAQKVRKRPKTRAQQMLERSQRRSIDEPEQEEVKPLVRAEQQREKKPLHIKTPSREKMKEEHLPQKRTTRAKVQFDQHRGIRGLIGSSFINYLDYDPETKMVNVRLGFRNYYTTKEVPQSVFSRWKKGEASCKTNDKSSLKRWTIGKTPSLGAFFNIFIKGRYGLVRGLA